MTAGGRTTSTRARKKKKKPARKPPVHWRKYLTQAELELPPPAGELPDHSNEPDDEDLAFAQVEPAWWQTRVFVGALVAAILGLALVAGMTGLGAARDRTALQAAEQREKLLTLRAINSVRALRIAPNPRSWSATPDATLAWPEPPQLLELHLPVGYADFLTFAVVLDKVDRGRLMVVERIAPDSNKELLLSLNSSALGPGEYRLRVQGHTWRGERVDVGWVRLEITPPRR
jgi:hypothetical protein